MDIWTPPEGATPQQYTGPADPQDGPRRIATAISDTRTALRDGLNHLLQAAGIRVQPGKLVIEGDLEVVGGIDNAQLKSPLVIRGASNYVTGFGLPGSNSVLASVSLAVPVGYTNATLWVSVTNSYLGYVGSGDTYVRAQAGAQGSWGRAATAYLYDTDAIAVPAFAVVDLTGLAGGTVTAYSAGYAYSGAKPAVPSNTADVSVVGFFTR